MPKNPTKNPAPKKGRPKNSGLRVPHWAHQAIARLSAHSGVAGQKILEGALRDGIQLVGEPLGAWVKYQKSSEKLWNEYVENPEKAGAEGGERGLETPPDAATDSRSDDERDIEDGDIERLELPDLERRHESQIFATNGSMEGE